MFNPFYTQEYTYILFTRTNIEKEKEKQKVEKNRIILSKRF